MSVMLSELRDERLDIGQQSAGGPLTSQRNQAGVACVLVGGVEVLLA